MDRLEIGDFLTVEAGKFAQDEWDHEDDVEFGNEGHTHPYDDKEVGFLGEELQIEDAD